MVSNVRVIVQARMGSHRFPGKSLAELAGRPLLEWTVGRLQAAGACGDGRWNVLVATSTEPADDLIEAWARSAGVPVVRGSETDVLSRFLLALADLDDRDIFLRATADNPFYCFHRTPELVRWHIDGGFDYTGIDGLSYAVPEILNVGAFRAMARRNDLDAYCREHATPYFRWAPNPFRTCVLSPLWNGLRPDLRLTVDTPADLDRASAAVAALPGADLLFPLDRLFEPRDTFRRPWPLVPSAASAQNG